MSLNINTNTPNGSIGRHPARPTPPDLSKTAPLFHPPRVNLWAELAEHQRTRPQLKSPLLLKDLFGQGKIARLRFREKSYALLAVEPVGPFGDRVRVVGLCGQKTETWTWDESDVLKLEVYP